MKKIVPKILLAVILAGVSAFLLKSDVITFWTWWLMAGLLGMIGMPVTGILFKNFEDKGWMFSKVLFIAVAGFLTWFLVTLNILDFTMLTCIVVAVFLALLCFLLFHIQSKKGIECLPMEHFHLIYWEEVLFFVFFLMWTYLAGFHPAAYGTEKFMDYGFMEAMMRSTELPATDMWYSEGHMNYYYGGQYFAVFLTKLTGSKVEITYNLMRTFIAGLAFVMPFSLVYQMTKDTGKRKWPSKRNPFPVIAGLIAGFAVSIAGNMHYVVYGVVIPFINKWKGVESDNYWFPDATRYIGFDPDVPDKTIHEFPCYSFVLGDLHAHVVNIIFVLLLVGILYAWTSNIRQEKYNYTQMSKAEFIGHQLFMPHILIVSFLLGMFQWTNFWDFVIYFVVTGGVVLFTNIIIFKGKIRRIFAATALQAIEVLVVSYVVILPFTLRFETMVQGVALAKYHSLPHQLLILWGLPVTLVVLFLISLLWEKIHVKNIRGIYSLMKSCSVPDLFAVIMGLCAMGLILIPELVYVRDIYENGNARANTMFKLTYQAYILFGMTMGYVIYRMMVVSRQFLIKKLSGICLIFLIWTIGYFGKSVESWFSRDLSPSNYKGLNATAFLETDFAEDAGAIRWLKANIDGNPVVLEANGDSYSDYERVSAMTGLPTVLGWYVHEWLWRNDTADLNQKSADVESIYTSTDEVLVEKLISQYNISYIFVGSTEKEKYSENLNHELIQNLGQVVYQDSVSDTYIVKMRKKG